MGALERMAGGVKPRPLEIVVTIPLEHRLQDKLLSAFDGCRFTFCSSLPEARDRLPDAEIVLTSAQDYTAFDAELSERLRWVHVISAGVELLPLDYLQRRNVVLTNVRGIHRIPMAEYTIGVMLQHIRQMDSLSEHQRARYWDESLTCSELFGQTVGIIGTGSIGSEIAARVKAFGMRTIGVNRLARPVGGFDRIYSMFDVESAFAQSDYIVLALPLTAETRGWIDGKRLGALKKSAVLINVSRGSIIVEDDLIRHLRERNIRKAVLDAFAVEPLPADSPFWTLDNCIVTPHCSSSTDKYMERAVDIFTNNLQQFLNGQPLNNVVDYARGY